MMSIKSKSLFSHVIMRIKSWTTSHQKNYERKYFFLIMKISWSSILFCVFPLFHCYLMTLEFSKIYDNLKKVIHEFCFLIRLIDISTSNFLKNSKYFPMSSSVCGLKFHLKLFSKMIKSVLKKIHIKYET